ncbi:MAG: hypothetical protein ABIS67_10875 [Candidatus Eisenbacteria bacterium]
MKRRAFAHLSASVLISSVAAALSQERACTARLVSLLEEVERRRLFGPAGYPSMFRYCVGHFRMSEDSAFKRIQAARASRRFPEVFEALEAGRLHLSAVVLIAPQLNSGNVAELIEAATHRTRAEIQAMLAARFPRPDLPSDVRAIAPCSQALSQGQLVSKPVGASESVAPDGSESGVLLRPEQDPTQQPAFARPQALAQPLGPGVRETVDFPRLTPLAPQRFAVQFTMSQAAHDDLLRAQELLSHQFPSGDIAQVFALALQSLNRDLEKQKFAATDQPRAVARPSENPRHIPAHVKRAVWERDRAQCTFVSDTGRRCESRKLIEFDHVHEVARGGVATISGIRLRCRTHNQYGAECTFGVEFMRRKREAAVASRESELSARAEAQSHRGAADFVGELVSKPVGSVAEKRLRLAAPHAMGAGCGGR